MGTNKVVISTGGSGSLTVKPKAVIFRSHAVLHGRMAFVPGIKVVFEEGAVICPGFEMQIEHERSTLSPTEWMR
jgi:hypothetical protein